MQTQMMQKYLADQKRYFDLKKEYDVVLPPMVPQMQMRNLSQGNWANDYLEIAKYAGQYAKLLQRKVAVIIHDTAGTFTNKYLQKAAWNELGFNTTKHPKEDKHGHGSHCAGIYGAIHPSFRLGICQEMVEKGYLKLIPAKCLNDQGAGSWSGINESVERGEQVAESLRQKGWFVIHSMSLGGGGYSEQIAQTIQKAIANGSVFVVAAGNTSQEGLQFPAKVEGVLAWGSHDQKGVRSRFSTYQDGLFAAAPGQQILSTISGNKLATWSGTSMATPAGGAVLATLASIYPELEGTREVKAFMSRFITDIMDKGRDKYTGYGSPKIGPYLGKAIEEEPQEEPEEKPDQPIDPPLDPVKPKPREIRLILPQFRFKFDRGRMNKETFYMKGSMEITIKTNKWVEKANEQVMEAVQYFLSRSAIVISEKMDVEDAAKSLGWFVEMFAQRHRDLEIEVKKMLVEDTLATSFIYQPERHWKARTVRSHYMEGAYTYSIK